MFHSATNKYLTALSEVHWSPSQATSALIPVKHGFCGVGGNPPPTRRVKQVHGNNVVPASSDLVPADGIWTTSETIAVVTADCLPILLASRDGKHAAAVHAGWRGVVAGIIPIAIQTLRNQGCRVEDLIACIGPAISREAFEVGPDVIEATDGAGYAKDDAARALTISKGRGDRWHLDLSLAGALQLFNAGIPPTQIEVIQACTKTLAGTWHSYRREGKGCGTNVAWIQPSQ